MGSRSRNRVRRAWAGGNYYRPSTGTYNYGYSGTIDYETCSDVTMTPPYNVDHNLTIRRRQAESVLRLNGTIPYNPTTGTGQLVYTDYNPANRTNYAYTPSIPSFNQTFWRTKALASINPYSPTFNFPLFLFELKDLPRMVMQAGQWLKAMRGRGKPPSSADTVLAFQLGWAPLVSDLLSLFDLTEDIENRMRLLRQLENGTRLRRRLFSGVTSDVISGSLYSVSAPYRVIYTALTRTVLVEKIWFTTNAKLIDTIPTTEDELRRLSTDIVTGLKVAPWTLWDYIPWSWLIDYFANIGDFMEAQHGLVHMKVTRMNLMATRTMTSTLLPTFVEAPLKASPSVLKTTEKLRYVYANPTPGFAFDPFLTATQMATLGALAMSRNRAAYAFVKG